MFKRILLFAALFFVFRPVFRALFQMLIGGKANRAVPKEKGKVKIDDQTTVDMKDATNKGSNLDDKGEYIDYDIIK